MKWQYQKEKLQNLEEIKEEPIIKQLCRRWQNAQTVAKPSDLIIFVLNADTITERKL